MSFYEQLIREGVVKSIEQGIERGVDQGMDQGLLRGIKAMMKLAMPFDVIAAAMELPLEKVEAYAARIRAGDE